MFVDTCQQWKLVVFSLCSRSESAERDDGLDIRLSLWSLLIGEYAHECLGADTCG